jgi:3-oxoacyl-[acyl-carrier protein] reductase
MTPSTPRIVVVTGASRGIGRAIAVALSGPDTRVYFNFFNPRDRDGETAAARDTEAQAAAAGGEAIGWWANIADADATAEFFQRVLHEAGAVDVLVNNAGITSDALLVRMKDAQWDAVIDVNLKGTFYGLREAAKIMMKQRAGRIVNIASIVGIMGNIGQANYVASKAGVIGLTKTAARELAPRGITVNAVAPGFIETDMTAALPEKIRSAMLAQVPLGRAGHPEDVAGTVAFLTSDRAAYITGQVICVAGGMYM